MFILRVMAFIYIGITWHLYGINNSNAEALLIHSLKRAFNSYRHSKVTKYLSRLAPVIKVVVVSGTKITQSCLGDFIVERLLRPGLDQWVGFGEVGKRRVGIPAMQYCVSRSVGLERQMLGGGRGGAGRNSSTARARRISQG